MVFLGGCTTLRREGPSWIGDNTGIMTRHIPALLRRWHVPSRETASLSDWTEKIRRASRETLDADVRMLSGTPSWVLQFGERVLEEARRERGDVATLRDVWPRLSLFVHGGVAFSPYRARFTELAGPGVRCTDTYSASEGGMLAVQDRRDDPAMLPLVDRGAFFEFVPENELGTDRPTRLRLHEVEPGVDYAPALTTDSGILAYLVGDLVRFVSVAPYRLLFAGRIAHTLNAFGEHVSGGELDRAIVGAAERLGCEVAEFAVAASQPDAAGTQGGHVYYVEFRNGSADPEPFADAIDTILAAGNEDYTTHRTFGLERPRVIPVEKGGFYRWMRARGKLGGQNKIPRVLSSRLERTLVESLDLTEARSSARFRGDRLVPPSSTGSADGSPTAATDTTTSPPARPTSTGDLAT
jgi:hypothetical protein